MIIIKIIVKRSTIHTTTTTTRTTVVNIIDFVDDFSSPKYVNYLMKHGDARIQIYKNEHFQYKIFKVKL
jgi:hypothetical protein